MSKNKRQKEKYYAIKVGKGVTDKIVRSWAECEPLVTGCTAVYKSFFTEEEAVEYLRTVNVEKIKEKTKIGIELRKKQKSTTKLLSVRLDKDLINKFEEKCEELGLSKEVILKGMIEEWMD